MIKKGVKELDNSYFVGWGTLALINAGLAQGKNRTALNWFILSLFLGPLATFILLFVEKR
ncbi:hypothetical protein ACWF7H_06870 [Peribacillus butanolivorans]|uniref:hypothetical protein n=1 Tax=Peribacillus TaxID=2675229 RepID=UPI001912842A|nr:MULTISPECIES: hypothetical protein [unclassified Peribacillus]MBK5442656.1 hypothetical protein [Peribacillus sp. TH24]MBK5484064.1 hypothetical protein [Peribacillus sp. TH16]WMX58485.1 hypothetical protein RE409_19435 [Peribacillus sp. R9-11]